MDPTGLTKAAQRLADWENSEYHQGFEDGCQSNDATEKVLNKKIEDLEALNETLKQRIAGRDETIAYLKLPWYRKLWMKLPHIEIYWEEK